MLARFRKIAYLMAYAVATIPLWHYIRDGHILCFVEDKPNTLKN